MGNYEVIARAIIRHQNMAKHVDSLAKVMERYHIHQAILTERFDVATSQLFRAIAKAHSKGVDFSKMPFDKVIHFFQLYIITREIPGYIIQADRIRCFGSHQQPFTSYEGYQFNKLYAALDAYDIAVEAEENTPDNNDSILRVYVIEEATGNIIYSRSVKAPN